MVIARHRTTVTGPMCRTCGLSRSRSFQTSTLLLGWWGVISFIVNPFLILGNMRSARRVRALAQPGGAPLGEPLDPGRPVWQRVELLVPVGIGLAAVIALAIFSPYHSKQVDELVAGDCIQIPVRSEFAEIVDCNKPHDAEIIGHVDFPAPIDDCGAVFEEFAGVPSSETNLDVFGFENPVGDPPTRLCLAKPIDESQLTTTISR